MAVAVAVAVCFVALAIINFAYAVAGTGQCNRMQAVWRLQAAAISLGVGVLGGGLSAVGVLGIIAAASVAQIAIDLWHRAHVRDTTVRAPANPLSLPLAHSTV